MKKIFGGINMTWPRLILFAVISGLITGLIALLVPEGNSIRQIAVSFEAWIVLAIIIIVNCEKPLEAACKTFVFFLISQPLVYLVQVPFNRLGFGLFNYYYPYWALWTLATFPGAFIAWFIRRDDWIAAVILSVALIMLVYLGCDYLQDLLRTPPMFLISTLFCFGAVPLLIMCVLHQRIPRLIAAGIAVLALIACLFLSFFSKSDASPIVAFSPNEDKYPMTTEWSVRLADPDNGTASLQIDDGIGGIVNVRITDLTRPADVILIDPDGNEYIFPATVIEYGAGELSLIY